MQTDLFKPGLARKTDPATSRAAAAKVEKHLTRLQDIVLSYIIRNRGTTDREMVEALRKEHGGSDSTWRTRRGELVALGLVAPLGHAMIGTSKHQTWAATADAVR